MNQLRKLTLLAPKSLKRFLRSKIDFTGYDERLALAGRPTHLPEQQDFGSQFKLGIIKEYSGYHYSYLQACIDLKVNYRVVDLGCSDWLDRVREEDCSAYLIWPSASRSIWREMFDYRARYLAQQLGKTIYPSLEALDIYENKLRFQDWMKIHELPHAKTFIAYQRQEALDFLQKTSYPVVTKTALGATASGVRICRTRAEAGNQIKKLFGRGIVPERYHPSDKQWGYMIAQEYIPNAKEWRMVRVGDSFFGYRKVAVNQFHSGSHKWAWDEPPIKLFDLLRDVTEKYSFRSMAVDIFEDENGKLYINEMQTVFGARYPEDQLRVDGQPGRYIYKDQGWQFEAGNFCMNACCNLRIEDIINLLDQQMK